MGQKISPSNSISNRITAIPRLTMNFVGRNNHVIAKNHFMQVLYKMKIYYIKNFHPMIKSCYARFYILCACQKKSCSGNRVRRGIFRGIAVYVVL